MPNILDYLDWRGDLDFARDGLNEVDNLILSVLSYLDWEGIVPPQPGRKPIPLVEAARRFLARMDRASPAWKNPFFKDLPDLLGKAAASARYRVLRLSGYVNRIDHEKAEQFSAVVFSYKGRYHFIAFRGTDDSLAGWKEDFHMSFMQEVPAQRQAVEYAQRAMGRLWGRFFLGGHSKGGNLAVYAASHLPPRMRSRILGVYSNDGPGFQPEVIRSEGYQDMLGRIHTLIPKSSVVGMLLEHSEDYKVVDSSETGIMQHNAFSWLVRGAKFVEHPGLTDTSLKFNEVVRAWLDKVPREQRAEFVNAVFSVIQSTGARSIHDLSKEMHAAASAVITTYHHMDPQTRSHLKKAVELFFAENQRVLKRSLSADIGALRERVKKKIIGTVRV